MKFFEENLRSLKKDFEVVKCGNDPSSRGCGGEGGLPQAQAHAEEMDFIRRSSQNSSEKNAKWVAMTKTFILISNPIFQFSLSR